MHLLSVVTLLAVVLLVGVEFSVSAFVNPIVWRLDLEPQEQALSLFASVLGRVMPFWYAICFLLLVTEVWLSWHSNAFMLLAIATSLWLTIIVVTIIVLVPINNRIAARSAGNWQQEHRKWDRLHRLRVLVLFVASGLLTYALVA
jgi:uncharacterized membrane protein